MHELKPHEYGKTRHVFSSLRCHLAIESIIQGLTPAKIFVDDKESPTAVITWFKSRVWLAGNSDNEAFSEALPRFLCETYYKTLRNHEANRFLLYYGSEDWTNQIRDLSKNVSRVEILRYHYKLDRTARLQEVSTPEGLGLHPINSSLLSKTHLKNLDDVVEELQSERSTVDEFLMKSFGYCAVIDNVIVGWCTSEYNVTDQCELGIMTAEAYRQRGIATLTGTAVIKHALDLGINSVGWHCYADNNPSIATAEKLGFIKHCEYPVCLVSI